ncbi:MAG: 50S ribosomal protein L6 [bacterium]
MSRIGKKPVPIPNGVTVKVSGDKVLAKGPNGELSLVLPAGIAAAVEQGQVCVTISNATARSGSMHGLGRSLIANLLTGVAQGYVKELQLEGVGFRAAVQGSKLTLALGFSHPIVFAVPNGIQVIVKDTKLTISGADKHMVGDTAARIRSFYPPEPYKGKGVRYIDEHIRRKTGKTVA